MTEARAADRPMVRDNPAQSRFEMYVDGRPAGVLTYRSEGVNERDGAGEVFAFLHTEVDPAFEGQGLGSVLVEGALDQMAARGAAVRPDCPFVRRFLARHRDYMYLVPASERTRIQLPERG